jgi:hypothetical protein
MSVLSLSLAKSHLNITVATHDVELQDTIDEAESLIADRCGPLESVATTERVKGGGTGLVVRVTPMVSLTSVTPVNGSAYDVTLFDVDKSAGVIEWTSGAKFSPGSYDVVYQAGRSEVPDALMRGIKELVRHLWETQRGSSRRPGVSDSASNTLPGAAFIWPFRVEQAIAKYVQVGN